MILPLSMFANADDAKAAAFARELGDKMGKTKEFRLKVVRSGHLVGSFRRRSSVIFLEQCGWILNTTTKKMTNSDVTNLRRRGLGGADLLVGVIMG